MVRFFYSFLIFIFCLFIFTSNAKLLAYTTPMEFTHKLQRWPIERETPVVTYEIIQDESLDSLDYSSTAHEAFSIWTEVETSYIELEEDFNAAAQISLYLQSEIDDSSFSAGYAEFDESSDEGDPIHCSIYVHVSPLYSYDSIAKTILHEIGHCLGLAHSLIPESIMSYELEHNSYKLDVDDKAVLSRLYPLEGEPSLAPGCAIGPFGKSSRKIHIYLLFFLPLLLVCIKLVKINPSNYF